MTRREFMLTSGAAFAAPSAIAQSPDVRFPFGAQVYREPSLPLDQVVADLSTLKALGLNMVKIQQSWAMDEQREGEVDFTRTEKVLSSAKENGLIVYFGVAMEQAPAWFWRKFPDAHMVYEDGQPHNDPAQFLSPADGKPGPCWHHPGAREAGVRFLETVARELGKYENIRIWNVNQGIGFGPVRAGRIGFCYCRYTLVEFRKWLRAKYTTLQFLNDTWRTAYSDWEEIDPPRFASDVPSYIDWRFFMDDVYLAQAQQWKTDVLRKNDPLKRKVMAHISALPVGGTSIWRYAESVDTFGASSYPASSNFHFWDAERPAPGKGVTEFSGRYHELLDSVLMRFDYTRSASRRGDFWSAELQGGPIASEMRMGRTPNPGDIRRWLLGSLAGGARGISFGSHRPERLWGQAFGFGLLNAAGDHTSRADEAGRIGKALQSHAELFTKGFCSSGRVAIAVDEHLYHFAGASGLREHLVFTIRGLYRSLWENAVPVDFVDAQRLSTDGAKYRAVILPFPIALSAQTIRGVKEYVENGGTLVSGPCPSRFSKYGFIYPEAMSPVLEEVFGTAHVRLLNVREPGDQTKWTGVQRAYGDSIPYTELTGVGELEGKNVAPAVYVQTLRLTEAKPVLMRGEEVAGCVNKFGKGTAYLVGTLLGHALPAWKDPKNGDFLLAILNKAGVRPDAVGKLQRRRRSLAKQSAWFLFNTTPEPVEELVPLEKGRVATDLLGGPLEKTDAGVRVRVEPLDVRCLLISTEA